MNVSERYESFQRAAVENIRADFCEDPKGRFLLVIPTGGGKTTAAIKAVHALYEAGQLRPNIDRAMWVVHREELKNQARESFDRFAAQANAPGLLGSIDFLMLSEIKAYLASHPETPFAVVDEAHHVAAKSYQPLFDRPALGILGLTATPSRHDGQALQFTRESFSIGFPELVSIGVLLRPNVIRIEGGTYEISDIGDDSDALEVLNNDKRNGRLIRGLLEHRARLNKVVIYVGTQKHARDLYTLLRLSALKDDYESISLILGNERRRWNRKDGQELNNETRKDFIAAQKASRRSILINVDVLTEGYDDPTVNAIVMARPTSSKLVYMQALGRAVRIDPENLEKEAYVIEVVDDLPNIKYRVDNRWLYSDISDILEPEVVDEHFSSVEERLRKVAEVFERYHVTPALRVIPQHSPRDRITMLLFKVYAGAGKYEHIPLVITNETRQASASFFNHLAGWMTRLHGSNIEEAFRPVLKAATRFSVLDAAVNRKYVFQAMENAWELVRLGGAAPAEDCEQGRPWITFVSFQAETTDAELGDDLLRFTEDMLNKDTVRSALRSQVFADHFYLVKFPLPLRGSSGVFLPGAEFSLLAKTLDDLRVHADGTDGATQWQAAMAVLGTAAVAIELRHTQSLTTIVRENLDYFRTVNQRVRRSKR